MLSKIRTNPFKNQLRITPPIYPTLNISLASRSLFIFLGTALSLEVGQDEKAEGRSWETERRFETSPGAAVWCDPGFYLLHTPSHRASGDEQRGRQHAHRLSPPPKRPAPEPWHSVSRPLEKTFPFHTQAFRTHTVGIPRLTLVSGSTITMRFTSEEGREHFENLFVPKLLPGPRAVACCSFLADGCSLSAKRVRQAFPGVLRTSVRKTSGGLSRFCNQLFHLYFIHRS